MDLPCPEWTQYVVARWTQLGSAKRESFSLLTDIDEMFNFAQSQVRQEDLQVLSRIAEKFPVKKSAESAVKFREQGNLSFKVKEYTAAALYYSRGVCYAGKNAELSLCHANRSAALFHLGLYSKCLEDIQRAFDEGYPSHLQCKLIDRRTQCLNQLKEQEQTKAPSSKDQTLQTAKKQDGNTCLPAGVSVQFTPQKGRHLLAAEKKSAGEVVLNDKAFSFVLIPGDDRHKNTGKAYIFGTECRYCHHCLRQTLSAVPCLGCNYAQYCGKECASEAWRQYHCWDCPAGSELLALGVLTHLALRVTLKAGLKEIQRARESCFIDHKAACVSSDVSSGQTGCYRERSSCLEDSLSVLNIVESSGCSDGSDHSNCYHGQSYLGIFNLLPHVVNHSSSLRFLLALTMAVLSKRLKEVGPSPETFHEQERGSMQWREEYSMLGTTALRHVMQLHCNAQAVTAITVKEDNTLAVLSSEEVRIATAVFPILSLLNHSCCPNTSISFSLGLTSDGPVNFSSGVTVTIRSCKDIAKGQELLHCYGPHSSRMDVQERQRLLLEQYFFHCSCEACKRDLAAGNRKLVSASPGLKCERCGSSLQASEDVHICSQSSCNYEISSIDVQRRMQMLQNHLEQALQFKENNKYDKALGVLQEAAAQADRILKKTHPLQGELADTMACVYATMGDWRQAALHLKHSAVAVRSQYGEGSLELGQQLFKLTQLYFNGRDMQSTLSVIPTVRHLLSLHCDPNCEELQELQLMEACLHGAV